MVKIGILIAYGLFIAVATLCRPDFLASNSFLEKFVGSELLSLLAVILAITFASVANIHLALNQIVARVYAKNIEHGQVVARGIRGEINSNAWLLFYAFLICTAALFVKALFTDNAYVHSATNGVALGTLLINILVFHDIYCTVFELAASDLAIKGAQPPDYATDAPLGDRQD
jgi:hypothetical protein